MSRRRVKKPKKLMLPRADQLGQDTRAPIRGYVHRGPDFDQEFQGWKVYAHKQPGIDVPVTIMGGHGDA